MADQSRPSDDATRLFLLVLRCQAGDEEAFTRLVDWFGGRTLAHLRRLVGDEAEDVQQEVWLTVYRHLRRLDNPRAFRTWLFQTTRHRAIDFLRARRRERELVEEAARDVEAATIPDETLAALDESALGPALAELPAPHREVLLLRYPGRHELRRDCRRRRLLDRYRAIAAAPCQAAASGCDRTAPGMSANGRFGSSIGRIESRGGCQ